MAWKRRSLLLPVILALGVGCAWWVGSPKFWAWRARVAIRRHNWDNALNHIRWLQARSPQDTSVRLLLAEALSGRGDLDAALSQLERVANDRQWASQVARRRGEILLLSDRASEAEASFKRCLSLAPELAEESIVSCLLLVKTYRWEGRQFEAQTLLEHLYRVSQQSGDRSTSLMALTQMFLVDYGEYESTEASLRLRRFVANDPHYVPARVALARLEFPNGDLEATARELESCLRAAPESSECRDALVDYGLNIAGTEPDLLEPIIEGWSEERRGFQFFRRLGELRSKQGRLEEAFQAFSKSIETRPDTPGTHHQLGMVLVRLGREEDANHEFRRSAEQTKLLDYERVKKLFESLPPRVQGGKAMSEDAAVFKKVAALYESIGRRDMAQRWYQVAERL